MLLLRKKLINKNEKKHKLYYRKLLYRKKVLSDIKLDTDIP